MLTRPPLLAAYFHSPLGPVGGLHTFQVGTGREWPSYKITFRQPKFPNFVWLTWKKYFLCFADFVRLQMRQFVTFFVSPQGGRRRSRVTVGPDVKFIFSSYGYSQQQTIAQKHTKGAKVLSRLCQILKKPSKCCQDSLNLVSLAGDKVHKVTRFLSKRKEVKWKKGEELVSSVTRFGVISPLWENFTSLWQNFHSSFHIRQNTELTLANLWHYWANFHYCKWPNIQK